MKEILGYLPPDLLTAIQGAGHNPKSYSLELGYSESWLYNLFQGKSRLRSYEQIADFGGITLDELIRKIDKREMSVWFKSLIEDGKATSLFDLGRKMEISDGLIRTLAEDNGKLDSIYSYVMLSKKSGVPLEKFRRTQRSIVLN